MAAAVFVKSFESKDKDDRTTRDSAR
jgi:hypothetical protein